MQRPHNKKQRIAKTLAEENVKMTDAQREAVEEGVQKMMDNGVKVHPVYRRMYGR